MTRPRYLIDTVVLIDHLNGVQQATAWLTETAPESALISAVTRAEVLVGVRDEDRAMVMLLLERHQCLSIDHAIADKAASLRRENRWKLPDAFQAALALVNSLQLVTRNTKDFAPDKYSFVHVPYRL